MCVCAFVSAFVCLFSSVFALPALRHKRLFATRLYRRHFGWRWPLLARASLGCWNANFLDSAAVALLPTLTQNRRARHTCMQPLWAVVFWFALASQGTGIFWLALASMARAEYAALTTQVAGLLVVLTSRVHQYFWRFVSQCVSLAP